MVKTRGTAADYRLGRHNASIATQASRRVTEAMGAISAMVEENTAATEQMAAQSAQVSGAIASIAAVSEEQSAAPKPRLPARLLGCAIVAARSTSSTRPGLAFPRRLAQATGPDRSG